MTALVVAIIIGTVIGAVTLAMNRPSVRGVTRTAGTGVTLTGRRTARWASLGLAAAPVLVLLALTSETDPSKALAVGSILVLTSLGGVGLYVHHGRRFQVSPKGVRIVGVRETEIPWASIHRIESNALVHVQELIIRTRDGRKVVLASFMSGWEDLMESLVEYAPPELRRSALRAVAAIEQMRRG